jgi:hypothetical protein
MYTHHYYIQSCVNIVEALKLAKEYTEAIFKLSEEGPTTVVVHKLEHKLSR